MISKEEIEKFLKKYKGYAPYFEVELIQKALEHFKSEEKENECYKTRKPCKYNCNGLCKESV